MKWVSGILLVLLLGACGVKNSTFEEVKEEPFTLRLISEKEQYRVGEQLAIRAELLYEGEDETIQIGHGGSWILLETTNLTKNYQFDAFMLTPYIVTTLKKGETLVEPYEFSGGTYFNGMEGNAYSDEIFEKMDDMEFSPGQYRIDGRTDFKIEGKEGEKYNLEASVIFEVVK